MTTSRKKNRDSPIRSWDALRTVMRKRFIPNHDYEEIEIGDSVRDNSGQGDLVLAQIPQVKSI